MSIKHQMKQFFNKYQRNNFGNKYFIDEYDLSKWYDFTENYWYDFIIYNEKAYHIDCMPIYSYFELYPDKEPVFHSNNTLINNYHKIIPFYKCIFGIKNKELVLDHIIINRIIHRFGIQSIFDKNKKIEEYYLKNRIKINTFSGRIILFKNANKYSFTRDVPIENEYIFLDIIEGNIIEENIVDNITCFEFLVEKHKGEFTESDHTIAANTYRYYNDNLSNLYKKK